MPEFELLGGRYEISNEQLGTAPESVLAQAAQIRSGTSAVIPLNEWPEPDQAVFEVVMGCYISPRPAVELQPLVSKVVRALTYFNLPVMSWPVGAQLHLESTQQQQRDDAAAAQIISAVRSKLRSTKNMSLFDNLRKRPSANLQRGSITTLKTSKMLWLIQNEGVFDVDFQSPSSECHLGKNLKSSLEHAAAAELMELDWVSYGASAFYMSIKV